MLIPCPICGSGSHRPFRLVRGFQIVQCSDCRFIFVNPRPAETELSKLYEVREHNPYFSNRHEPLEYEFPTLIRVVRTLRCFLSEGSLLEVGCGRGDLLGLAQKAGFSVTGCDIFGGQKPAIAGACFVDGKLVEAQFPDHSFDVVVMRNLVEHLFDPNREAREVWRILKPNGYLYLKVPNADFEYGYRCRLVFRRKHAFEPPHHLNHFNVTTLKRFLKNANFHFLSWQLEPPTRMSKGLLNLVRQAGFKMIGASYYLTFGRMFPKIVLSCMAQKMPVS